MKYITPLFWSLLAVIALVEFSSPRLLEASSPDLISLFHADMTVLK